MINTTGSNSTMLAEFWAEARAELEAREAARQDEEANAISSARELIARSVPAEILEALGLHLENLGRPPRRSDAYVCGSCVFYGASIETKVTTADRGTRVALSIGGSTVHPGEKLRVQVGIALGEAWRNQQAARRKQEAEQAAARQRKVDRLRTVAANWAPDHDELQNRALTAQNLPFAAAEEIAELRGTVARRKWDARRKHHAERKQAAARQAAAKARAAEVLAVGRAWADTWLAYGAAGEAWARRWAADLGMVYGTPELWELTYGPRKWPDVVHGDGDCEDAGGEGLIRSMVVLESPADLPAPVNGLTVVTEVTPAGQVREVWVGPVLHMARLPVQESITERLAYHRSVTCGEWVVNVPPTAPAKVDPAADRPETPESLDHVFEQAGFGRLANKVRWGEWGSGGEVAGLDLAGAAALLD